MLFPTPSERPPAEYYINQGFTERSYTTPDGKGKGVAYFKAYPHPDGITSYHAMGFRGKAIKPTWNFTFRSLAHLEDYINKFFESIRTYQEYKTQQAQKKKDFVTALKPGDILDTCWGYDQTNREFFQVLSVTKKTAVLREVAQKQIAATGPFSATVIGLKDQFLEKEPEISRRILEGDSIKISECQYASLWNGSPVHCSWGA
jgi:hypothetical protein